MANETSPLNAEQIGFAKEKAKEVGTKALAYARTVANGNASIRVMALIGGFALVVDSLSSFLNNVLSFHWDSALINFYAMFIGLSAIIMESDKEAIPYATMLRAKLGKNFGIVRSVTGRGLFYGIAGTLEMSAVSPSNIHKRGSFVCPLHLTFYLFHPRHRIHIDPPLLVVLYLPSESHTLPSVVLHPTN